MNIEISCQIAETKSAKFKLAAVVAYFEAGRFTFGQTKRGLPSIYFTPAGVEGAEPKRLLISWEDPTYGEDGPEIYPIVRGYERFSSPPVRMYADVSEALECAAAGAQYDVEGLCVFRGLTEKGREFFDRLVEKLWDEYYRRISAAEEGGDVAAIASHIAASAAE